MVLISILVFAILAYYFAVFLNNKKVGYTLSFTFIAFFILGLVLLVSNEYGHFGMQKVVSEKTYQIQSIQKGSNLLLKKELGTKGKEDVYIYRTPETSNKKKPTTTKVDVNVTNKVKTGNYSAATLERKTTRWEYKNGFYSFLFGISDNNKEFVKQTNTFKVGNDWLVLTTTQASQLQKKMKSKAFQAQMKQEGATYVKEAVMKAMKANPKMTADEQKQVTQQAEKAFKAEAQAKLIQEIKAQK